MLFHLHNFNISRKFHHESMCTAKFRNTDGTYKNFVSSRNIGKIFIIYAWNMVYIPCFNLLRVEWKCEKSSKKSQRSKSSRDAKCVLSFVVFSRRKKKNGKRIWHQGRSGKKSGSNLWSFVATFTFSVPFFLSFSFYCCCVSSLTLAMTHLTNRADRSRSWAEQWRSFQLSWELTTFSITQN